MKIGEEATGVSILGTDTEVGKTYQACILLKELVGAGVRVGAYKPVASGVSPGAENDPDLLLSAAALKCPVEDVCPQQFSAACAPPIAARLESRRVDEDLIFNDLIAWKQKCDFLVVEGVGGALAPLTDRLTTLDLAERVGFPTVLVAANRLGVVNHTLLSIAAIKDRGLELVGIVLNTIPDATSAGNPAADDISRDTNLELLREFAGDVAIVTSIVDLFAEQKLGLDHSRDT